MKQRKFENVLQDALKDPAFKQEWKASATQYKLIKTIISKRLKLNITQEQLARKAGLKQPSLARIESGSVMPSIKTLHRIASALGTKLEIEFA